MSWDSLDTKDELSLSCFHDRLGTFILHVPSTAKMIFISAAAVIFLVTKFKEVDWAKTCVVLPDEEEDHERYFLSDQPHSKVGEEPTPQMVRSVSDEFVKFVLANKNEFFLVFVNLAAR